MRIGESVHNYPRQKLRDIIMRYGDSVLEDPRRCKALLMDYCGEYKGEINLIYLAVREKVPQEMRAASPYLPTGLLYGRLTKALQDAYFFTEDVARWAVETCAHALQMPAADAHMRVFTSTLSTKILGRSWTTTPTEWVELGTTPGSLEIASDYEIKLSTYADDVALQKLVKECTQFGPIQEVDLRYSPLTDMGLKRLASLHGVTALDISGSQVTDAGLAYLVVHQDIEKLVLCWCDAITDAGLKHLYALNKLRELDLSRTHVTDEGLATVGSIRSLENLDLGATHLTDEGLAALRRLHRLKRLVLDETNIAGEGLRNLEDVRQLVELSLFRCVRLSNSGLASLRGLDFLSSLNLGDCGQIIDQGLVHVRSLHGLTDLCLEGTAVTDTGLRYLQDLVAMVNLDVGWTAITDEGVARLRPLVGLKQLTLSGTRITDTSLEHLSAFRDLAYLDLANTRITDKGLGAVTNLQSLLELDLESTSITDAGLEKLKPLRNLTSLFLSGTRITDVGIHLLTAFTALRFVDISQCEAVTESGLQALSQAGIAYD